MNTGHFLWISFYTLAHKEVSRFFRIWVQTLLPSVVSSTLYFIIFGKIMGNQLIQGDSFSYIDYLAPGLMMMSIINNAYANVSSSVFGAKFGRHIEEILVSPMPNWLILLGYLTGGILRALFSGVLVLLTALLFTDIQVAHLGMTMGVAFLAASLFSLAGFLNGLFANSFDNISLIPNFILMPLIFLGGVFYSVDQLPSFWHGLSLCNPILYLVSTFRFGVLGIVEIPVSTAINLLILTTATLFFLSWHFLNRGMPLKP